MCCNGSGSTGAAIWDQTATAAAAPADGPALAVAREEQHGLSHAIMWMAIGALLIAVARSQGWVK